jgi:chorismate mutase
MAEHENSPEEGVLNELASIRQSIDNIDAALIHLLAERFKFTQSVGRLKAVHGLPAADPARELRQIQRLRGLAEEAHLDPAFAEKFLNFIIAEVIHHHVAIAGGTAPISTVPASTVPASTVPSAEVASAGEAPSS